MSCTPLISARSSIGLLRFNGGHLARISSKITFATARLSTTAAAGTRRRIFGCGQLTMDALTIDCSSCIERPRRTTASDHDHGVRDALMSSPSSGGETSSFGLLWERYVMICTGVAILATHSHVLLQTETASQRSA